MRIISQDGKKDIPYDFSYLFIDDSVAYESVIIGAEYADTRIFLAKYDTLKEAQQEMDRLWMHYHDRRSTHRFSRREKHG